MERSKHHHLFCPDSCSRVSRLAPSREMCLLCLSPLSFLTPVRSAVRYKDSHHSCSTHYLRSPVYSLYMYGVVQRTYHTSMYFQ
ncbi:hypothetical protein BU24DRAFT_253070 [Aaosphaeria arxii CBS 175.79]|uniref:Uncharacterized protein n=1 Tax=Aaosphaeria arxii CBS 175.79 TaxID=1450172 RepID=A0A6A5XI18_9PLEO|nr:uncharacterized protein BU24DRAFT_253070 [Aaosphaeria arxii CBS 175.79]KAF2012497.1 hypothetical protein BU24DRAFT_253070 [Aaosphaeria arxii CBS 175.79]